LWPVESLSFDPEDLDGWVERERDGVRVNT
jgi:hypothetical protein